MSADRRLVRVLLRLYLLVYYSLIIGAVVTIWRSGLLEYLHGWWTVVTISGAVVLGALLALSFRK